MATHTTLMTLVQNTMPTTLTTNYWTYALETTSLIYVWPAGMSSTSIRGLQSPRAPNAGRPI
jgi:hypothetical protein